MTKDNSGPAFPRQRQEFINPQTRELHSIPYNGGMSLRDWFAGMALQGLISNRDIVDEVGNGITNYARGSYMIADAMLKARE